MTTAMASSPGHDRPNEDFVGAVPGAMVLVDGAGIPESADACSHGVAWYARTLGEAALERLSAGLGPVEALADAIEGVAGRHRHSCDLTSPVSPQATVAMLRYDDHRVDHLVLADAYVVLDVVTGPVVITDPREVEARDECAAMLDGLEADTPKYKHALSEATRALRARRNRSGGYWVAKDDPEAATQAVAGSHPRGQVNGAALLSNGAARVVDPYGLADWPTVLETLRTQGPEEILRLVRDSEQGPGASPDDATVAYWPGLRG